MKIKNKIAEMNDTSQAEQEMTDVPAYQTVEPTTTARETQQPSLSESEIANLLIQELQLRLTSLSEEEKLSLVMRFLPSEIVSPSLLSAANHISKKLIKY